MICNINFYYALTVIIDKNIIDQNNSENKYKRTYNGSFLLFLEKENKSVIRMTK